MEYIQSQLFFTLLYSLLFGLFAGLFQTVLSFFVLVFSREKRKNFYKKPVLPVKIFSKEKLKEQKIEKRKTGEIVINILTFITDVLYFIILAVALSIFYYYTSDGEFRAYVLLGIAAGFCVYRLTLKRVVLAILVVLADVINYIFDLVAYVFCTPFVLIYKLVKCIFIKIRNVVSNKMRISFHKKMIKELQLLSCNGFLIKK